jgi:hypothetical protein
MPQFFKVPPWDKNNEEQENQMKALGELVLMLKGQYPLITNMWGDRFQKDWKFDVSFFRASAELISSLSKKRGGTEIPTDVAQKWIDSWLRGMKRYSLKMFHIPEGMYLSDFVTFSKNSFVIDISDTYEIKNVNNYRR